MLGKKPADLQTGIRIGENSITGTLKYVSGYTGFNGADVSEQSGNFIALKFDVEPEDCVTTVEIVGGKKGAVQLDEDMLFVGRISNKDTQSIKVVSKKDGKTATKTYRLNGLILEKQTRVKE